MEQEKQAQKVLKKNSIKIKKKVALSVLICYYLGVVTTAQTRALKKGIEMEKSIKSTIDVTCGIYDTEYTVRDYRTHIVVTEPYIKWVNNSGNLAFCKHKITNVDAMAIVRIMADDNEMMLSDGDGTINIEDIFKNNYSAVTLKAWANSMANA